MIIKSDSGIIKLNSIPLNGILQSLSVNGEIVVDSYQNSGEQYTNKIMRGYKDKIVVATLKLVAMPTKTTYEQLEELENLFQDTEDSSPTVYMITNEHISNRGISHVIFTQLSSSEDNTNDTITVTITLEEFVSSKVTVDGV